MVTLIAHFILVARVNKENALLADLEMQFGLATGMLLIARVYFI